MSSYVEITEQQFLETVHSGKRPPRVHQKNDPARQLIVEWPITTEGKPTDLVVRVYSSIFGKSGEGLSRDCGEDSIRVALVDAKADRGLGKATWTCRTPGWDQRLKDKIREVYLQGREELEWRANAPQCPRCVVNMAPRTVKRGKNKGKRFYGCPNYPDCDNTIWRS